MLNGHNVIIERLLTAGALTNVRDHEGWMAIHVAAWTSNEEMVRLLLAVRDVNGRGKDNLTAQHCATAQGHKAVAQLFIDNGASLNMENNGDCTPLHLAAQKRHNVTSIGTLTIGGGSSQLERLLARNEDTLTAIKPFLDK